MNQIYFQETQKNSLLSPQNNKTQGLIMQIELKKMNAVSKNKEADYQIKQKIDEHYEQKYQNSLNSRAKCENWSKEDSTKLFQYHTIYGNKWAKISTLFGDRSDNNIKNHFYSTLRKSHRIINKFIKLHHKKIAYKFLKDNVLSKIISLSQKISSQIYPDSLVFKSKGLLKKLVILTQQHNQGNNQSLMEEIIDDLLEINKGFKLTKRKRKSKLDLLKFNNFSSQQQLLSIQKEVKQPQKIKSNVKLQSNTKQRCQFLKPFVQNPNTLEISSSNYFLNNYISLLNNSYWMYNNQTKCVIPQQQGYFYHQSIPFYYPSVITPTYF